MMEQKPEEPQSPEGSQVLGCVFALLFVVAIIVILLLFMSSC